MIFWKRKLKSIFSSKIVCDMIPASSMPIFLIAKDKNLRLIWVLSSATAISNRRWTKNLKMIHLLWWTWVSIMMMSSIKTVRIVIYSTSHAEFYKIGIDLNSVFFTIIFLRTWSNFFLLIWKYCWRSMCTVQVFIPKAGLPLMIMIGYLRASIVRWYFHFRTPL